ncbi:unnamed protein product [Allacma fusca]|uniref:Uncharacterized protein n=1 Tax=Allacma fusca TaxID=39272 RepID=A0A8J2JG02_9HEXA|nr:unnamed protein product [Allacma fusca]
MDFKEALEAVNKSVALLTTKIDHLSSNVQSLLDTVATQNDAIKKLENITATQQSDMHEMRRHILQLQNDLTFQRNPETERNLIIRGPNSDLKGTGIENVVKSKVLSKLVKPEEADAIAKSWIISVIQRPSTNNKLSQQQSQDTAKDTTILRVTLKSKSDIRLIKANCSKLKGSPFSISDDLSYNQRKVLGHLLKYKRDLKMKNKIGRIYANRYLITSAKDGKDEYFESNGVKIYKINSIPNYHPQKPNNSQHQKST